MQLSTTGFSSIVKIIRDLATELCHSRLVLTLEGGYKIDALAYSVKATFDVLLGKSRIDDPLGSALNLKAIDIDWLVKNIRETHKLT